MGLDMIPLGKPKKRFEKRFKEIFELVESDNISEPTKEELIEEWFDNQIQSYETIKAPMVGRDPEAEKWLKIEYKELEEKPTYEEFFKEYQGFYVIPLAKEQDGVPYYMALGQDENVFRGQLLVECVDIIGEELVNEAWETKLADETLDYGNKLMTIADKLAKENELEYLKDQRIPPDVADETLETKLHIVYSLSKWLIFYGKNGHGYEADY